MQSSKEVVKSILEGEFGGHVKGFHTSKEVVESPPAMPSSVAVTGVDMIKRSGSANVIDASSMRCFLDVMGQLIAKSFIGRPSTT